MPCYFPEEKVPLPRHKYDRIQERSLGVPSYATTLKPILPNSGKKAIGTCLKGEVRFATGVQNNDYNSFPDFLVEYFGFKTTRTSRELSIFARTGELFFSDYFIQYDILLANLSIDCCSSEQHVRNN